MSRKNEATTRPTFAEFVTKKIEYNTVTALGAIITIAPPKGHYVVLIGIDLSSDTLGNGISVQMLDTDEVWRTITAFLFIANHTFTPRYPCVKLKNFKAAGQDYEAKAGDGKTVTVRIQAAAGAGIWTATIYYYTEP